MAGTVQSGLSAATSPPGGYDHDARMEAYRALDRLREACTARLTAGLSPAALTLALFDWSLHMWSAPGKRLELADTAIRQGARLSAYVGAVGLHGQAPACIEPLASDYRFKAEGWDKQPFAAYVQTFLLAQQWWSDATRAVPGVTPHHEEVVSFVARQLLDVASPSNSPFTNPEVIERTIQSAGSNFVSGFQNWMEDATRLANAQPPIGADAFLPGRDVALTPGKVVYRNHLIELLQYSPATGTVFAEPVLIVPAWIMKFYILDLSAHNSLVRYLVERGHTVFYVSWRNPTDADRDLSLDDYRRLGVMAALDAIAAIVPGRKVNAAGYCLGGTLLSIAAAAMARVGDDRLSTVTLLAAQTDFSEPGELALFIDPSQMHFLESMMWNRGYLSSDQMSGAFQILRSNDLVWSRLVRDYLMGERTPMTDLMAWNADSTRMPYRMHTQYLQRLYLDNELATGRFMVDGRPAALQNIRVPLVVVGTERDHVAPWRSVHKIHQITDTDVTFVLTSGGHNAGIVSEPGHRGRRYSVALKRTADLCLSPDEWVGAATQKDGSWWEQWQGWLEAHSLSERIAAPGMGAPDAGFPPICDAPGTYVFQK